MQIITHSLCASLAHYIHNFHSVVYYTKPSLCLLHTYPPNDIYNTSQSEGRRLASCEVEQSLFTGSIVKSVYQAPPSLLVK